MNAQPQTLDIRSYNQGTRGIAGVSLARYWVSIIFTVIVFIIGLVVDSLSKEVIYSYGHYGYGYAYNPNRDTIEVLGIITGVLSIVFLLTYLILFIIYFVRLYDFRRLIPGDDVRRGAGSLITSLWLIVGSFVLTVIFVAVVAAAENPDLLVLMILPALMLLVGFIFEIIGFGQLQGAGTLHRTTRNGFSLLFISDLVYCFNILLAIILATVTSSSALRGEDVLTGFSTVRIVCGIISLVIMVLAMIGWSMVGKPVSSEPEGTVPEPAPVPQPAPTNPEPAPATPAPVETAPEDLHLVKTVDSEPEAVPEPALEAAPEPAPEAAPEPEPEPAPAPKPRPKFCTNCGSPLTEGAKFCGNCGTPVA